MKKASFWIILLALVYAILEGGAWIGYRLVFGETFSFSRLDAMRGRQLAMMSMESKIQDRAPVYLLHPYYGYIINPNWIEAYRRETHLNDAGQFRITDRVNAHGFFGEASVIQRYNSKKLIVAITGGSVAAYAGSWGRDMLIRGLQKIPAYKDREIVLLNFGQPAYKQPQQVMVIGDILAQGGHIDLLINIDGFNEIALPRAHDAFGSGTSPFFPQNWRLTSETRFSPEAMIRLGRIALLQRERFEWAHRASRFPLHRSVTASAAWRFLDGHLSKRKIVLEQQLAQVRESALSGPIPTTADGRTALGPPNRFKDARELYQSSASLWARSSVLLNNMIAGEGGLFVHVLQPNQYFPGSKPIEADEARVALSPDSPYKGEVERGYPYLRSAGRALVKSGVRFFDLTTLFENESAPVYIDACCHFTRDGNDKLVGAIVSRVAASIQENPRPRLATHTAADYEPSTLRALALMPMRYVDGSGESVRRADVR